MKLDCGSLGLGSPALPDEATPQPPGVPSATSKPSSAATSFLSMLSASTLQLHTPEREPSASSAPIRAVTHVPTAGEPTSVTRTATKLPAKAAVPAVPDPAPPPVVHVMATPPADVTIWSSFTADLSRMVLDEPSAKVDPELDPGVAPSVGSPLPLAAATPLKTSPATQDDPAPTTVSAGEDVGGEPRAQPSRVYQDDGSTAKTAGPEVATTPPTVTAPKSDAVLTTADVQLAPEPAARIVITQARSAPDVSKPTSTSKLSLQERASVPQTPATVAPSEGSAPTRPAVTAADSPEDAAATPSRPSAGEGSSPRATRPGATSDRIAAAVPAPPLGSSRALGARPPTSSADDSAPAAVLPSASASDSSSEPAAPSLTANVHDNVLTPVGQVTQSPEAIPTADRLQSSVNMAVIHQAAHGEVDLSGVGRVSVDARVREGGVDVRVVAGRSEGTALLLPHAVAMEAEVRAANVPLTRLEISGPAAGLSSAPSAQTTSTGGDTGAGGRSRERAPEPAVVSGETTSTPAPIQGRVRIVL